MAGFHQPVAQGAQGVGLAGAGQSEGQDVDAVLHETALGQMVQLLPDSQKHPVVFENPAPVKTGVSQVLPEGSGDGRKARYEPQSRQAHALDGSRTFLVPSYHHRPPGHRAECCFNLLQSAF